VPRRSSGAIFRASSVPRMSSRDGLAAASRKPARPDATKRKHGESAKTGTRFWVDAVITPVYGGNRKVLGFTDVSRDITERKRAQEEIQELNQSLQRHAAQLEAANKELEAFSYSVSHDLRAPLRGIDGFSLALMEDYADKLDAPGRQILERIRAAASRMAELIDDLLNLARVTRADLRRENVDLSAIAKTVLAEWRTREPERSVDCEVQDGIVGHGDPRLLRVMLENLLGKRVENSP